MRDDAIVNGLIEWARLVDATFGVLKSFVIEDVAVVDVALVLIEAIVKVESAAGARFIVVVSLCCVSVFVTFFNFKLKINVLNIITRSLSGLTFKYCNNLE